ncbi:MAG TPA: FAD-dependent oxidoreductase [Armatimonadota bacterium]|jgi:hypothetical protein
MLAKAPTYLERAFEPTTDDLTLELRVRTQSSTSRRGIGFGVASGAPSVLAHRAAYLAFLGNGTIAAHDGQFFKQVGTYTANTWVSVRVAVSVRLGGMTVWLNGRPATTDLIPLTHGQERVDRVFLTNEGADPEVVRVAGLSLTGTALTSPAPLSAASVGGSSKPAVELSWHAVPGAEGYRVYRGHQRVAEVNPSPRVLPHVTYRDAGVTQDQACSYRVTAVRGDEESLPSWPTPVLVGGTPLPAPSQTRYDVVIFGGTPGGVAAAVAAARRGASVLLLSHNGHVGGMISGGLGQTDLRLRQAASGLFKEMIGRIRDYYLRTYGADSRQYQECGGGYWIEPSVGELTLRRMLAEEPGIHVAFHQRLTAVQTVPLYGNHWASRRVTAVSTSGRDGGTPRRYTGTTFIDASYEGDLAAKAGAEYRVGREGRAEHGEEYAGIIYWDWESGKLVEGTTGEADSRIQAYCYRLTLTNRAANRVPIARPEGYDAAPYGSIAQDVAAGKITGIAQVIYFGKLPNEKYDINNMGKYWPSTDYIEENTAYPSASDSERESMALAHRRWALGLLYYLRNDPGLPEEFRRDALQWGLPADEHQETGNFPEQLYVREARRIVGRALFTENDARSADKNVRAPLHPDGAAVAEYPLDSHATRKREPGHPNQLEGFFYLPFVTRSSQIPFGVLTPKGLDALMVCVATSGTHVGNSTIRLEPIYMALGEVCGTTAARAARLGVPPNFAAPRPLQDDLLSRRAQLTFFNGLKDDDPAWAACQYWGTQGLFPSYDAATSGPIRVDDATEWLFRFLAREKPELWEMPGLDPKMRDPNSPESRAAEGRNGAGTRESPYVAALRDLKVLEDGAAATSDASVSLGEAALWIVKGKQAIGRWRGEPCATAVDAASTLLSRGVLVGTENRTEGELGRPVTRGELALLLFRARN